MSDWQPIETAPKDGTWVLLFDPRSNVGIGIGAFVQETHEVWVRVDEQTKKLECTEDAGYWSGATGHGVCLGADAVTHWMPLPNPPTERIGDE